MIKRTKDFLEGHKVILFFVLTLLLCILYSFVFEPLYILFSSDYAYAATLLPEIFTFLASIAEICIFLLGFTALIWAFLNDNRKRAWICAGIYAGLCFFRIFSDLGLSWLVDGFASADLWGDIGYALMEMGLEILLLLLSMLFSWLCIRRYLNLVKIMNQGKSAMGDAPVHPVSNVFPLKKWVDLSNPAQKAAFISGGLVTASRVTGRLIYDLGYGAPTDIADALWMIAYYLSDFIVGLLCYLFMLFLLITLAKRSGLAVSASKKGK